MFYNPSLYTNNYSIANNSNNSNCSNSGNNNYIVINSKIKNKIYVNTSLYTIKISPDDVADYNEITYVATIETKIILPIINEYIEKVEINIINNSSSLITIQTPNKELLYNSLYLPSTGATSIKLIPNKYCKIIFNNKDKLLSYILLLT